MLHYLTAVHSALHSFVSAFKMLSVFDMAFNTSPGLSCIALQSVMCSSALCFFPYVLQGNGPIRHVETCPDSFPL
jgi:hypothetical protein